MTRSLLIALPFALVGMALVGCHKGATEVTTEVSPVELESEIELMRTDFANDPAQAKLHIDNLVL